MYFSPVKPLKVKLATFIFHGSFLTTVIGISVKLPSTFGVGAPVNL